jgi:hypothetical protein
MVWDVAVETLIPRMRIIERMYERDRKLIFLCFSH